MKTAGLTEVSGRCYGVLGPLALGTETLTSCPPPPQESARDGQGTVYFEHNNNRAELDQNSKEVIKQRTATSSQIAHGEYVSL